MTSTKRYNGVGKRISSNIWVHRTYASEHLTTHELNALELVDFQYDVVRLDLTTRDIALIRCEDFDGQHEPVIVETLNLSSGKRTTSNTNPLSIITSGYSLRMNTPVLMWPQPRPDPNGGNCIPQERATLPAA